MHSDCKTGCRIATKKISDGGSAPKKNAIQKALEKVLGLGFALALAFAWLGLGLAFSLTLLLPFDC